MPEDRTDADLAADFAAGSDDAFDALYRRYAPPLFDFLRWTVRDPHVAQDLVQSTFLSAYERRESLRDPAAVRGWLYRIAHNAAMNHVTRTKPTNELDDDAPYASADPGPAQLAEQAAASDLVWDAAASLEPRQFAVLDLSVRKGLTSAEIADVLGVDAAAASLAVHRSREALGNAVRFLLVARRRRHCDRLAELVPEGVRRLTPEQRASVDRHMRRCESCQRMALALTAAEQLFAATPLVALPYVLRDPPRPKGSSSGRGSRARQALRSPAGLGALAIVVAVVATLLVVVLRHGSSPKPQAGPVPITPVSLPPTTGAFRPAALSGLPAGVVFSDVTCPSADRCFAVGTSPSGGVVATTADGGSTWTASGSTGMASLAAVACTSETTCVVGGRADGGSGMVTATTSDGGTRWVRGTTPASALITVLRCPSQQSCLAVGEEPRSRVASVISSTDGGRNWSAQPIPQDRGEDAYLGGARCLDATHCWVVGSGIWFTPDLGATWEDRTPAGPVCPGGGLCGPPLHTLTDVEFTSPAEGWAAGGVPCGGYGVTQCPSYLGHTTDGGATWEAVPDSVIRNDPYAEQIHCSAATCLVVGQTETVSVLSRTTDGGATWQATQTVGSFVHALGCSPDAHLCVLAGGASDKGVLLVADGL